MSAAGNGCGGACAAACGLNNSISYVILTGDEYGLFAGGKDMAIVLEPIKRIRMTPEEYEALSEGPPFYEYIKGEAIEVNRPTRRHQIVNMRIGNLLWDYCRDNDFGIISPDTNAKLPSGDWVSPDSMFVSKSNSDKYDNERGVIIGAPDLIVEVSSPSTMAYDRGETLKLYSENGVKWVWFVDQDTLTIEEFQLTREGYVHIDAFGAGQEFSPKVFPELTIDMANLMAGE
jgi:Uma2 family endonuclease